MRYSTISAAALAILINSSSVSSANPGSDAAPAPLASVIAIMKDAGQALLWDGKQGEYVVVRVGDRFHEYQVTSITPEQVVLTRRGSTDHFVLPRTSDTSELVAKSKAGQAGAASPAGSSPAEKSHTSSRDRAADLLDPYPSAATVLPSASGIGDLSMLDPYGTSAPITTVVAPKKRSAPAPLDPYTSVSAPATKPVGASAPLDPYTSVSAPATKPAGASAPLDPYATVPLSSPGPDAPLDPYAPKAGTGVAPKTYTENHRISRRELDNAVTDFQSLSKEVQFIIVDQGVRVDGIAAGSLFHRWGFRAGDIIMNVDGKSIRGVDDAAAVYAHLMEASKFTVKVARGADTVTMNFRFKK